MSDSTPEIDDQALEKFRSHYKRLSVDALVAIASLNPHELTVEARRALTQELRARENDEEPMWTELIEKTERAPTPSSPLAHEVLAPRWNERPRTATAGYGQAVTIARWLAFIPATWQASHVHIWILRMFGSGQVNELTADSNHLLAFGAAGFLTPLCAIAVGLWVCPAKVKTKPAVALSALYAIVTAYSLFTFSRPGVPLALRHLFGLDAIITIAVSVMVAGVCLLAPWQNASPASAGKAERSIA